MTYFEDGKTAMVPVRVARGWAERLLPETFFGHLAATATASACKVQSVECGAWNVERAV